MKNLKVIAIDSDSLIFENDIKLESSHNQDCCENHYLCFDDLTLKDFDGLYFDLSNESFFERLDGFGISLKPINGFPIRVPGYGYNNGYYGSNLDLVISDGKGFNKVFNIDECQNYSN